MNTTQANPALMQMEDIVLPPPISQFPIAAGYWILLIVIIAAIVILYIKWRKSTQYHAPRKAALSELKQLDINDKQYASHINTLLKRTALTYLPRQDFAKLDGEQWYTWLERRLPVSDHCVIGTLLAKRYQACGLSAAESQQLFELTNLWLGKKTHFEPISAVKNVNSKQTSTKEATCSQ
ncbi:DUF4381 domain-containing protein [Shewanella donghaensis]|uniref:DUF4381 domain-containing protein n=1 Tax=Shewanella donghaensis TaxID=238836 RepID=UPI0011833B5D|nr:DUF4381 domain-containing protein [Shewanella donghaensis]